MGQVGVDLLHREECALIKHLSGNSSETVEHFALLSRAAVMG